MLPLLLYIENGRGNKRLSTAKALEDATNAIMIATNKLNKRKKKAATTYYVAGESSRVSKPRSRTKKKKKNIGLYYSQAF